MCFLNGFVKLTPQVPCHAISNHPCCQSNQPADVIKPKPGSNLSKFYKLNSRKIGCLSKLKIFHTELLLRSTLEEKYFWACAQNEKKLLSTKITYTFG